MSTNVSLATIAEYFRLGLQIGLLLPEQASAWADSVIVAMDTPPGEIIEVSWSKGLASTLDALSLIPGERDKQLAGRWLLGLLRESITDSDEGFQLATRQAMHIARNAELGNEVYYRFDMVDDELSLARTNVYGTVEKCREDLLNELADYPTLDL